MSANGLSPRRLDFNSWLLNRKVMLTSQEILMLVVILILMQPPPEKKNIKRFLLPFLFLNHKRQRGRSSLRTYAQNPTRQPSSYSRSPRALVGKQQMPRLHEQEGMRITRVNQSKFPSPGATGACLLKPACYPPTFFRHAYFRFSIFSLKSAQFLTRTNLGLRLYSGSQQLAKALHRYKAVVATQPRPIPTHHPASRRMLLLGPKTFPSLRNHNRCLSRCTISTTARCFCQGPLQHQ